MNISMVRRLSILGALGMCGLAYGQGDFKAVSSSGPILKAGEDAAPHPTMGCCVVGENMRVARWNSTGSVLWETQYLAAAPVFIDMQTHSVQHTPNSNGWAIAGLAKHDETVHECYQKNAAIIHVDDTGALNWGAIFPGDYDENYVGYKFSPRIQLRELPDYSIVAVTGRIPRNELNNCERVGDCGYSTGVVACVSNAGTPVFAREYGVGTSGSKSKLIFVDLTVVGDAMYVLGTADVKADCQNRYISAILVKMNFSGAVLGSWAIDHIPNGGNPQRQDWSAAMTSIGNDIYFGCVEDMPVSAACSTTIYKFNTVTNTVTWAANHADFRLDFGTLEPGAAGTIVAGGFDTNLAQGRATEILTATGAAVWNRKYVTTTSPYQGIRSACYTNSWTGYWLHAVDAFTGDYHMFATNSTGKTLCTSSAFTPTIQHVYWTQVSTPVNLIRELPIAPWTPETTYLHTAADDTCD